MPLTIKLKTERPNVAQRLADILKKIFHLPTFFLPQRCDVCDVVPSMPLVAL